MFRISGSQLRPIQFRIVKDKYLHSDCIYKTYSALENQVHVSYPNLCILIIPKRGVSIFSGSLLRPILFRTVKHSGNTSLMCAQFFLRPLNSSGIGGEGVQYNAFHGRSGAENDKILRGLGTIDQFFTILLPVKSKVFPSL